MSAAASFAEPFARPDKQQRRIRLRRLAAQIHVLGPRPLLELLLELDRGAPLMATLERYARLPAEFIHAFGGDSLDDLRVIEGDRDGDDAIRRTAPAKTTSSKERGNGKTRS
jgi:hypothetical protein